MGSQVDLQLLRIVVMVSHNRYHYLHLLHTTSFIVYESHAYHTTMILSLYVCDF